MTAIKKLFVATRFPFISVTVIPVLAVVFYMTQANSHVSVFNVILILMGTVLAHLGANTLNDYSDWDESDSININSGPFNGGSRTFLEGKMKKDEFLKLSVILYVPVILIWIYLAVREGVSVLLIGILGIFCGILYSAKPFSFQKRGLGELLIFAAFGPLLTLGTAYALGSSESFYYILLGIPFGFLTLNIIFLNEIPDYEADKYTMKNTWVVRLGKKKAGKIYLFIHLFFYLSMAVLFILNITGILTLLMLIPAVIMSVFHMWNFFKNEIITAQKSLIRFQSAAGILITSSFILSAVLL